MMSKKEKLIRRKSICLLIIIGVFLQILSGRDTLITNLTVHTVLTNLYALAYFIALIMATKKNKDKDYHPWLRFSTLSCLLLTFFIANTALYSLYLEGNFCFSIAIIILHIIVPVLVTIDFVKAEKCTFKNHYIVTSLFPSLGYSTVWVLLLAIFPTLQCPYPFLNFRENGILSLFISLAIISVVMITLNYIIYKQNEKKKN